MENSEKKTIGFKALWHKEADLFDACYGYAAKINNMADPKKTDIRLFLECSKQAREHCGELRHIVLDNLKLAIELANNPEAEKRYVDVKYEPRQLIGADDDIGIGADELMRKPNQ
jgi:hypothetical protein